MNFGLVKYIGITVFLVTHIGLLYLQVIEKCEGIASEAKKELHSRISSGDFENSAKLAEAVDLLQQLGVSKMSLQVLYLLSQSV